MAKASTVINIALGEVGYKEKASNSYLDLATANAGSANWTKYARDLWNAGYYNGNKNGYAWCDCFVDWCFYKAFGKTEGQLVECQTGELGAACPYSAGYYKAQGRYDKNPKAGDQVFFQQNGSLVHTGIVISVNGNTIACVEGNAGNMVKQTNYNYKINSYVAGFGHPKYDEESDESEIVKEVTNEATNTEQVGDELMVTVNKLKKGNAGAQVKTVQRILYARGIRDGNNKVIKVDGDFGNSTYAAVKKLQKQLFPNDSGEWDGVVGKNTWTAMLTKLW